MITKGAIVEQAFTMLAISGVTVSASNEDVSLALKALEAMVPSWEKKGIYIGYIKSCSPDCLCPSEDSGIVDTDFFAVYNNLAVKISPAFGKQAPMQLMSDARDSYNDLFSVELINMQPNPNMPVGAGDRRYCRQNYFQGSDENISVEQDGNLDLD